MCMLSKDPRERPSDAAALSDAADALRRKDTRGAVEAVPALAVFLEEQGVTDPSGAETAPWTTTACAPPIPAPRAPGQTAPPPPRRCR